MRLLLTSFAAISLASFAHADPHNVFGTFMTVDKDSHVEIADCGDGSPCGKIVWIDPNSLEEGQTPEALRIADGRATLGLEILNGFSRKSKDWRSGKIFSPKESKTYASRLKRLEDGTLQVKGCIGPFCQTQIWTPVE